jgi:flagellar FliJ protein
MGKDIKAGEMALARSRFAVNEAARKVADLERTIRDLEGKATDLDWQLRAEEDQARIKDPTHFAYSSFAHSARMRRDKLLSSVADLKAKLGVATREHAEALSNFAERKLSSYNAGIGDESIGDKL